MRVIHTIASLRADHGGPARTIGSLCAALHEAGVDVELVTRARRRGEAAPLLPDLCVPTTFVNGNDSPYWITAGRGFRRVLQQRLAGSGTALLHDHGLWLPNNHAAARVAKGRGVRRLVSVRGMLSAWALDERRAKKRIAWLLYQKRDLATADVLHATAETELAEIRAAGLRQPVAVIPNGSTIPPAPLRAPGGEGTRRALFLSRLHPKKGLPNLIRAWALMRPAGWELVIVGPDESGHRAEVEALRDTLGLESTVRFEEAVADDVKWAVYANADLFVLPTLSENFGLVVAEALASEVPVITTRAAPWGELAERRCGWWVDTGEEPLVAALREAVALTDAERQAMGRRGRELIRERYAWPAIAGDMRAVYEWMVGTGPRPACVDASST